MLVLTCKEGESVYIGDDIVVMIRETKRGSAKVAIKAPREIVIEREALRKEKERGEGKALPTSPRRRRGRLREARQRQSEARDGTA